MTVREKIFLKLSKIFHYEFWPYQVFYFPMFLYGLILALKARSFTYYTTTNPSMKYGGIMGESKIKVLSMIPEIHRPKSILIPAKHSFQYATTHLKEIPLRYPVIAKPDIGERGFNVELIKNESMLRKYFDRANYDFIIQEFIDYPLELGVLYYKIPGQKTGHISSVVIKEFLVVKGDGNSTLEQLLDSELRAANRIEYLKDKFYDQLNRVLNKNEKILVEPIGNHCRGTTFLNGNHLINDQLVRTFDSISQGIPEFYYGRFDIKVPSLNDLYNGENIKVLELNGVSSEPAHIYDPKYNLFAAYRDVKNHMNVIYKIAGINHRQGLKYAPLSEFLSDARNHLRSKKELSMQ